MLVRDYGIVGVIIVIAAFIVVAEACGVINVL